MLLANNRIVIDARPTPPAPPVLEVVMLGHCPGTVQWQRLAADDVVLNEIAALGFSRECTRLRQLLAGAVATCEDDALLALYDLPLPLHSFGQYQSLFPDVFDTDTSYLSVLGGKRAWLPLAVQDFFENRGGENNSGNQTLKLWIIRVDESKQQCGFLPTPGANMIAPETLGAFERALLISNVGVMALPDLERLQIPAHLEDIPHLRIDNIEPAFLPCGTEIDAGHRVLGLGNEISKMPDPLPTRDIVIPIARTVAKYRPDMQCLLSVALAALPGSERPGPATEFLDCVANAAGINPNGTLNDESRGRLSEAMRHLQLIYPYLRGPDRRLGSAVGVVAGMQASVSQQYGPWRSIGERPLPGRSLPWPPMNQNEATTLRDRPGATVLLHRANRTVVDDERMCAPCLPTLQLQQLSVERRNDDHWRSAEIMRFMGWIQRQLQALGEKMIFDVDVRDPRPEIALRSFFTRLYTLGALRGRKVEEAFTLKQRNDGESTIIFEIEIAPAYPIDRLRITFMQDRNTAGSGSRIEVSNG